MGGIESNIARSGRWTPSPTTSWMKSQCSGLMKNEGLMHLFWRHEIVQVTQTSVGASDRPAPWRAGFARLLLTGILNVWLARIAKLAESDWQTYSCSDIGRTQAGRMAETCWDILYVIDSRWTKSWQFPTHNWRDLAKEQSLVGMIVSSCNFYFFED